MTLIPLPEPKPRPRDEIFEALCELFGKPIDRLTKQDRARLNAVTRDLKIKRADVALLKRVHKKYSEICAKVPTIVVMEAMMRRWDEIVFMLSKKSKAMTADALIQKQRDDAARAEREAEARRRLEDDAAKAHFQTLSQAERDQYLKLAHENKFMQRFARGPDDYTHFAIRRAYRDWQARTTQGMARQPRP